MSSHHVKDCPKTRFLRAKCLYLVVLCVWIKTAFADLPKNTTSAKSIALPKAPPLSGISPEAIKRNSILSVTPESLTKKVKETQRNPSQPPITSPKPKLQSFSGGPESSSDRKAKSEDDADVANPTAAPPTTEPKKPATVIPPESPVKPEEKPNPGTKLESDSEFKTKVEPDSESLTLSQNSTGGSTGIKEKPALVSEEPKKTTQTVEALSEPKTEEKSAFSWNLIMIIAVGGLASVVAALFIFAKVRNRKEPKADTQTPWSATDPEKKDYKGLYEKAKNTYPSSQQTESFDDSFEATGSDISRISQSLKLKEERLTRDSDSTSIFYQSTMASQTFSAASSDIYSDQESVLSSKWNQRRSKKSSFVAKDSVSEFSDFGESYTDYHSKGSYEQPNGGDHLVTTSNLGDGVAKLSDVDSDWDDTSDTSDLRDTDLSSFSHSNPPDHRRKNEFEV
ncbi:unnamed protein product [Albugo candida]|uniref:Uncharacterized protein n=1 Tax=Albugo candida TaxID=65357 RepID=A0A024GHY2_9STRA|nr:unnamed protein product [Albugo candida]|eukprot:CCI46326.1 unnamed protein product [Albugo candida]